MSRIMKINKTMIFVFLFMFINQYFAYLINADYTKIFGIAANDWSLIFDIFFGLYLIFKYRKLKKPKYEYALSDP